MKTKVAKKYKVPRSQEDLNFPIDRVYLMEDKLFFVTLEPKTGSIIAKDYDNEMRCFFATYFEYLLNSGYIKLTENGEVVDYHEKILV